jgi:ABC-type sugar transport system permease subunit
MQRARIQTRAAIQDELSLTRNRRWVDRLAPYLFIAPFMLAFVLIFLGPALYSLVLSFARYRGYGEPNWIGLTNYRNMLQYAVFWTTLRNVFFYWIAHSLPMMPFAFLLAVLINSKVVVHKHLFKPIIYMPQVVAGVASALLFQNFFGTKYGILNTLLGVEIPWLTDPVLARWAVVFLLVWRGTGYWFVVFMAGLTSISEEVMEASIVDGANAWQRMIHVTVPLMRNSFLFAFVVDAIVTLRLFAEPNVLAGKPGTLASTWMAPVVNLIVEGVRAAQFGQAAAVGWLLFIVTALISWFQFRIFRERDEVL